MFTDFSLLLDDLCDHIASEGRIRAKKATTATTSVRGKDMIVQFAAKPDTIYNVYSFNYYVYLLKKQINSDFTWLVLFFFHLILSQYCAPYYAQSELQIFLLLLLENARNSI